MRKWTAVAALICFAIGVAAIVPGVNAIAWNEFKPKVDLTVIPPNLIAIFERVMCPSGIIIGGSSIEEEPLSNRVAGTPIADIFGIYSLEVIPRSFASCEQMLAPRSDESRSYGDAPGEIYFLANAFRVTIIPNNQIKSWRISTVSPSVFPFYQRIMVEFLHLPVDAFEINVGAARQLGLRKLSLGDPSLPSGNARIGNNNDDPSQGHEKHSWIAGPFFLVGGLSGLCFGWTRLCQCSGYWREDRLFIFIGIPFTFIGGVLMVWGLFHILILIS